MRPERLAAILSEPLDGLDWSAAVIDKASIRDLDEEAIKTARLKFKEKFKNERWIDHIEGLDDAAFLDRAGVTANGQITRTAILLLGKAETAHYLSPHPCQLTWKLDSEERAYEHFSPPFLLTTTKLFRNIRNVLQKLYPANQLIPYEVPKYEAKSILEGLHNCIAHQDYERCERVLVTETTDRLIFENAGGFFDGQPEDYFTGKRTPKRYRNHWLAHAMAKIGMIDTMGYGIHEMTKSQRSRFLPLQNYRGSTSKSTRLEVLGRPIDQNYTQLLLERKDLDLETVILLDRVQKGSEIPKDAAAQLRREGLIEGRMPHLRVAAHIARATETEAAYLQHKGADKKRLKEILLGHLRRFGSSTRPQLDELLIPMLSSLLTDKQKSKKVTNLLSEMQTKDRSIISAGRGPGATWSANRVV
jgi:ATP-dependent DNA helicase RecG